MSSLLHLDMSFLPTAKEIVRWVCSLNLNEKFNQFTQLLCFSTLWKLWEVRHNKIFQGQLMDYRSCIWRIRTSVIRAYYLLRGRGALHSWQQGVLHLFNIRNSFTGAATHREVWWVPPSPGWHKVNCDGVVRGSSGLASCGGVFRNSRAFTRGSFAQPLGIQLSLYAEIMGFIISVEIAIVKG